MSIRSIARTDVDANLTADGDEVTLTPTVGDPIVVNGKVARIESYLDPQLGVQIFQKRTAVTVSLADLGQETDNTWVIGTTDSEGNAIESQAIDVRFDRTLGFVTFMMEEFE